MDTETNTTFVQDQQAVQAVRGGDAERYRELVERHERRVFAVAWSRLGDATLAEEVAQESFIRAYRRLWLLGDGAKFSAWIAAITRRLAINCGLRHRRELNKRRRWALEQTATPADESAELCPPETLRQALADLPAKHRECLVLFYLEGKSGVEAAAALGISETALRVRLHRARAALREQLDQRLAESLEQLRPSRPLSSAVMGAILSSSAVKMAGGTGIGIKILSFLMPFKFFGAFFFIFPFLPGLLFNMATMRMEQRNYRDAEGFRARLHRRGIKRIWIMLPLLAVPLFLIYYLISTRLLGIHALFLVLGVIQLVIMSFLVRRLTISPNRFHVSTFVGSLIMAAGCLAVGLNLLPGSAFNLFMMTYLLVSAIGFGSRQQRADSSLFIRATQKMLGAVPVEKTAGEGALRLNKSQLRAFARFLADRWLIIDHRWRGQGLLLQLPPLTSSLGYFGKHHSSLTLQWNGSVSSYLGEKDEKFLLPLQENALSDRADLEKQVAASVQSAWWHFRRGEATAAARAVGEVPDAEVYIVPPARSKAVRWRRGVVLIIAPIGLILCTLVYIQPPWMTGLKPVNVSELEIRATLAALDKPAINPRSVGSWMSGLDFCFVLPPTNLFTPGALKAMQKDLYRACGVGNDPESKLMALSHAWTLHKAVVNGWISYADLGVTPAQASAYLRSFPQTGLSQFMRRRNLGGGKEFDTTRLDDLPLAQLRWLRDVNCLDLLDRQNIVTQLRSAQVLSGKAAPGQPPVDEWRRVRGLFDSDNSSVLQETYCALAALEILGALNEIDREACIQGILRLHRSKGYFPRSQSNCVRGDAQDTFCAFESLRILGALDRVKDLDKWKFRPAQVSKSGSIPRMVTWDEIEAWVCQQRLTRDLAERQQNPAAPWRSLLDP